MCRPGSRGSCCRGLRRWTVRDIRCIGAGHLSSGVASPNPGQPAELRVLVAAGADLQLPSQRDQITPLAHAMSKGHSEIAKVLNDALKADRPSKRVANRRLLAAAERGDATAAALAIRAGANLETRDERRRSPLLLAVTKGRLAVARLLVYLGADPDALDERHDTPWLVTGVTGSVDMLEVLLPARPDLRIRNRFGGTSLSPASERGYVDYVRRVVPPASISTT